MAGERIPTWSGQPNIEKGKIPDENHVSNTSSSESTHQHFLVLNIYKSLKMGRKDYWY